MDQMERDILKRHMVDACVKMANNAGRCDAMGVLRGTLFLADGPISMDQLVESTGYSKSTVSSNMAAVERMGHVNRGVVPVDKRYYYLPVMEQESLKRALIVNMRQDMQILISALDRTEADLRAETEGSPAALEKIDKSRSFYRQTDKLLDLISRYNTDELIELLQRELK